MINILLLHLFSIGSRIKKLLNKWYLMRKKKMYLRNGKKPWSIGYNEYKWRLITQSINNNTILNLFSNGINLPTQYGVGIDERIVEYPWVIAQLNKQTGTNLLDAGSTLNYEPIITYHSLKNKKITIVNLNPEKNCFWRNSISYIYGDIRKLPFKDNTFDVITCISTIEHIGLDNTIYTGTDYAQEKIEGGYNEALEELLRVLIKEGGKLFITVPFGVHQIFGFFQVFDQNMINQIASRFTLYRPEVSYFKYSADGWQISSADECRSERYFNVHKTKYFDKTSTKDFDTDNAAAARAIACITLTK